MPAAPTLLMAITAIGLLGHVDSEAGGGIAPARRRLYS
jgi:hypothetical protein